MPSYLILLLIVLLARDYPANDCGVLECPGEEAPNRLQSVIRDGKKGERLMQQFSNLFLVLLLFKSGRLELS